MRGPFGVKFRAGNLHLYTSPRQGALQVCDRPALKPAQRRDREHCQAERPADRDPTVRDWFPRDGLVDDECCYEDRRQPSVPPTYRSVSDGVIARYSIASSHAAAPTARWLLLASA